MRWYMLAFLGVAAVTCAGEAADQINQPDRRYGCKAFTAPTLLADLHTRAQAGPSHPDQNKYDVARYTVDVSIDVDAQTIAGTVLIEATCIDPTLSAFVVDLRGNMTVGAVLREATPLFFYHTGDLVTASLDRSFAAGEPFSVRISYGGQPVDEGWGTFRVSYHGSPRVPILSTLAQPSFARYWWPNKDHPADKAEGGVDATITINHDLFATSNGRLVSVDSLGDGLNRYRWRHSYPISSYLFYVSATNYTLWTDTFLSSEGRELIIEQYVYPELLEQSREAYATVPEMLALYSEWFGSYPFPQEKYGQCMWELPASMEHQTCSGISRTCTSVDCRWLYAHELAHQWWGDWVTNADWDHLWLHEGFASYAEALYAELRGGVAAYRDDMRGRDYGQQMHEVLVPNPRFSVAVYQRGAWVVHMLRGVIGKDALRAFFHRFLSEHAYATATTEQLHTVCEEVAGLDLDWFFNQWVYNGSRPDYRYSWKTWTEGNGDRRVVLRIRQAQSGIVFTMPVEVQISTRAGKETHRLWNDRRTQYYTLSVSAEPVGIALDPNSWILKYASVEDFPPDGAQLVLY